MRVERAWRYAAVSVLGVAGVVSTSFVGTSRSVRASADAPFASCAPTLLAQRSSFPNSVFRVNVDNGNVGGEINWSGSVPLDLSRADYDPDGTLYAIMKTSPGQRAPRWAAVDLQWGRVTNVSPLPADLAVIDFAFTPSANTSPRGYLLAGSPEPNASLQLYAIDSAWPLVVTPVATNFPAMHNYSLGLGVSANGSTLYYTTQDGIYERSGPSTEWVQSFFLGVLSFSTNAHVAGPAAGESPRIAFLEGGRVVGIDLQNQTVSPVVMSMPPPRGTVFRECPQGGVRLVPQSGLTTTEAGGTAEFTAVLTTRPQGDVTVRFKSTNPAEGKVRGRPLLFTPDDWNVPQTVTVAGIPDGVMDGSQSYWITAHPLESGDPAYDGRETIRIPVVNIDVDFRGPREPAAVESRRSR